MRFKGLDLNLLIALDVLLEERSVTRAANRLHLSQPATSGALARLREYFEDDLIRTVGRKMVPTAKGEQLHADCKRLLGDIDRFITSQSQFDPASSTHRFRIVASDYVTEVLLAPVVRRLSRDAPHIAMEIYPPGPRVENGFRHGDIDAIIVPGPYVVQGHPAHLLYSDYSVIMGADDNPAVTTEVSQTELLELEHVVVDVGGEPNQGFYEDQLRGLRHRIKRAVAVSSFLAVPSMLVGTDRVSLMHRRLAELLVRDQPLTCTRNPFQFEPFNEWFQIHEARQDEPELLWLLDVLKAHLADDG